MPKPNKRSRTFRRIYIKTPSKRNIISYRRKKPKLAHCSNCNKPLQGVPRALPFKMRNMPKSQKRPERIFGGTLCPKCAKRELIRRVRK
jgi:large subunit ribosomal protein L34e